jgi:carbamoyl-phosphate synthase large subunit
MRSTGEVMGLAADFHCAFWKAQCAAGNELPTSRDNDKLTAFVSVKDADKPGIVDIARRLVTLGFEVLSTSGTAAHLTKNGLRATQVKKVKEGRPSIVDRIIDGGVHFVINTTAGKSEIGDSYSIRRETLMHRVPYFTTLTGARAALGAMEAVLNDKMDIRPLQQYHHLILDCGEP